jgi:Na+/proline symporter
MRIRFVLGFLVAALALVLAPSGFAQGCAMCTTSAAAQGAQAARSFNLAILVLLLPTLLFFFGILLLAVRLRNPDVEDRPADRRAESAGLARKLFRSGFSGAARPRLKPGGLGPV